MVVAYELKLTLDEVGRLSKDEIGWWLAFIKLKQEREAKAARKKPPQ
jgi:hypothetical protein